MSAPELPEAEVAPAAPLPRPGWAERLGLAKDREALVVLVAAVAILLVSWYDGSTGWFNGHLRGDFPHESNQVLDVLAHLWWFGTAVVLYILVPCVLSLATGAPRLSEVGAGLGDRRFGLAVSAALLAVMLPVAWAASHTAAFIHQYPMSGECLHTWRLFLGYELAYVAYFVAWEFLFRGWMLFGLARRLGPALAIAIQTVPFALMHIGKPELEAYGSIVAGLALGALAWRARSFWYGALVHAVVAVAMDVLCGFHRVGILNFH